MVTWSGGSDLKSDTESLKFYPGGPAQGRKALRRPRSHKAQMLEHIAFNGSFCTAWKQHQKICLYLCQIALASCVNGALITFLPQITVIPASFEAVFQLIPSSNERTTQTTHTHTHNRHTQHHTHTHAHDNFRFSHKGQVIALQSSDPLREADNRIEFPARVASDSR